MGASTAIAWTDATYSPWWGCQRVSPGCGLGKSVGGCYAESWAKRTGHAVWGPKSPRRFFGDRHWNEPRVWNRKAMDEDKRVRVFCASMCDVFEDRRDLDSQRERLWVLIEETPHLDWQLLTKRPENMTRLAPSRWSDEWPDNVWAGCTAEDQKYYDLRWPRLARVPARIHFISHEPALGPLEIKYALDSTDLDILPDWVITGGESGPGSRPYHVEWARGILAQCRSIDTVPFVKQLGENPHEHGLPMSHPLAKLDRKWTRPELWPTDLRVQEFPA